MKNRIRINFKNIILGGLFIGALIGGISIIQMPIEEDTNVVILSNILIFIFSTIIAVIISYFFSKSSNTDKIDTIAYASVEKMANLSIQLKRMVDYLNKSYKEIITDTSETNDKNISILLFKHKINDIRELLLNISSSNETLRADWLGVVSEETKEKIQHTYQKLNEYLGNWDLLNTATSSGDGDLDDVTEIINNMKTVEKELKFIPRSNFYAMVGRVVKVTQTSKSNTTGVLKIEIIKDTYRATGTGKIEPNFESVPYIKVKLISKPRDIEETDIICIPGCGTVFDFNITIKSKTYQKFLALGEYEFEYEIVKQGQIA